MFFFFVEKKTYFIILPFKGIFFFGGRKGKKRLPY